MSTGKSAGIDSEVKLIAIGLGLLFAVGIVLNTANGIGNNVADLLVTLGIGEDAAASAGGLTRNGLLAALIGVGAWAYLR